MSELFTELCETVAEMLQRKDWTGLAQWLETEEIADYGPVTAETKVWIIQTALDLI